MSVIVDLDGYEIQIPDAISSPKDTIGFEDDRTAFSFIENEINQRRTLFGIPHPADSKEFTDIKE